MAAVKKARSSTTPSFTTWKVAPGRQGTSTSEISDGFGGVAGQPRFRVGPALDIAPALAEAGVDALDHLLPFVVVDDLGRQPECACLRRRRRCRSVCRRRRGRAWRAPRRATCRRSPRARRRPGFEIRLGAVVVADLARAVRRLGGGDAVHHALRRHPLWSAAGTGRASDIAAPGEKGDGSPRREGAGLAQWIKREESWNGGVRSASGRMISNVANIIAERRKRSRKSSLFVLADVLLHADGAR